MLLGLVFYSRLKKTSDAGEIFVYYLAAVGVADMFQKIDYGGIGAELGCLPSDNGVCWESKLSKLALTSSLYLACC